MPAVTPVETIDDDDGFDWEAAVKEIDVACQVTVPSSSTSYPVDSFSFKNSSKTAPSINSFAKFNKKKSGISRQSTLDKFVGTTISGNLVEENRQVRDSDFDNNDERMCCIDIDAEAAKTWIYPVNVPVRGYQFSITEKALFSNTLVALPTGLGKTLIAAVVMYNYFRWFPKGKIVFAAPSRPLVTQQIEACHNIVGIPLEWTIDMTGQTSPEKRACLWKSKRVFFVTPQVLEKDIQSGTCNVKDLVCLVIDEAHRAMGNYSYSVIVRELMAIPVQLRILALSATPGADPQTVQKVIDNLSISTLEYRSESNADVIPHVHDRKSELIEVAMGEDAIEINNLLYEVIRPFVVKLTAYKVLQHRDYRTMSPHDFLTSRENFRAAPPSDLHPLKHKEIEGYFGLLLTLYHIRKLLLSHGIRPAYEMLEEKSRQGNFARFMTRNEDLHKVKLLMQKSLSHGKLSPKMAKLTEVLIDHFEKFNPQSSRVIIFSHFRESVRDIMSVVKTIGDHIKATEFIGQTAGKTLRGQSQKVQQAVLEKFRAGGYNVIVSTLIGEEGLDIMEVDLVICFDSNISSLRMTQRTGRTGRKNDGRVVILACEGSEIKGYKRKVTIGKSIAKHMQNGGIKTFQFHSSPRMIPHIFKPEVQYVKLSIEEFVRHGKKATDNHLVNHTPMIAENLSDTETELIKKYFQPTIKKTSRLSLIAFPHFQAFPSRVHHVKHSFRTGILIDALQHLQDMPISKDSQIVLEDEAPSSQCLRVDTMKHHAEGWLKRFSEGNLDLHILENNQEHQSQRNISDTEVSPIKSSPNKESDINMADLKPLAHSYLFGSSDFISVDALGKVLIMSVPFLPVKENSQFKQDYYQLKVITEDYKIPHLETKDMVDCTVTQSKRTEILLDQETKRIIHSPNYKTNHSSSCESPPVLVRNKSSTGLMVNDLNGELSPRLTNLIQSGVVPESPLGHTNLIQNGVGLGSPLGQCGLLNGKSKDESSFVSPFRLQSPLANLTNNGSSEDWLLKESESVKKSQRFKRLRKLGDSSKRLQKSLKINSNGSSIPKNNCRGTRKPTGDVRAFFEDEAEESSEGCESDDDDIDENVEEDNSYDDSFIDDRLHPTAASSQSEAGRIDMMAIYRRSLLTQSPMEIQQAVSSSPKDTTPETIASISSLNKRSNSSSTCKPSSNIIISPKESEFTDTRKRKLSFYQIGSAPKVNLNGTFARSANESSSSLMQCQDEKTDDDYFYESLDLDAVEAQATLLLTRKKSELAVNNKPQEFIQNFGLLDSPSFDLGI